MSKNHSVTVSVVSKSGDVVNQEILCIEYASTEDELVEKNFIITDHVVPAVDAAMKEMASKAGHGKGKGK